jgi:hypothetical protein
MGLIRSGNTDLTPLSEDSALTSYLWPIVCEMVKTAIENDQSLIVEGCYIPHDWQRYFEKEYLESINYCCLIMSEKYIKEHFADIKKYANVIEKNSPTDAILRKAFKELQKADTDKKKELLKEISKFEEANNEWLEPKSIYEALSFKYGTNDYYHWNYFDMNLYNTDIVLLEERINAIKGIKNCELNDEIEFYKFKQFLADKHLTEARTELNKKGPFQNGMVLIIEQKEGFSKAFFFCIIYQVAMQYLKALRIGRKAQLQ